MKRAEHLERQLTSGEGVGRNYDVLQHLTDLRYEHNSMTCEEARRMGGFRTQRYSWLRQIAIIAHELKTNDADWRAFADLSVWAGVANRPHSVDRVRPERWLLLTTMVPQSRRDRQLLSKYAAALEELDFRRTPISHFVKAIEDAGGIEALARQAAKRRGPGRGEAEFSLVRLRCSTAMKEALESLANDSVVVGELRVRQGRGGPRMELIDFPISGRE